MAKNSQRARNLTITDKLTLGNNAFIRIKNGNDYDEISLTELLVLNGITATTAELNILDGVTATASEINQKCDVSTLHEAVTTTNIIAASETGKHFILNSTTGFVSTLPAAALGLEFWFHIGATEPSTTHTVVTNASANIISGNIVSVAGTLVAVVDDADTISFISSAVHGDFAHVWCDGTTWFLDGQCEIAAGMTTTQAS